ncbi:hypothetical protein TNCV_682921 [Trichonephila clavipes]|nr:hypothetical protein TNCV_682921 [Trichonephila clavipes]
MRDLRGPQTADLRGAADRISKYGDDIANNIGDPLVSKDSHHPVLSIRDSKRSVDICKYDFERADFLSGTRFVASTGIF